MDAIFRLGITQRVERNPHGQMRDCLEHTWHRLVNSLGVVLCLLPNALVPGLSIADWLAAYPVDAVILSGGNTPGFSGAPHLPDHAPERDALESFLLENLPRRDIPILGVCRGMQMINVFFGGTFAGLEGHVRARHALLSLEDISLPSETNSFHNYGIVDKTLGRELQPLARCVADGSIEAFRHAERPIFGVMWHPEREETFDPADRAFIHHVLRIPDSVSQRRARL